MKNLLFLAVPLIFSNLINAASSLISMYLLSRININALAAGAIITSTYGLITMIIISMPYSVSIMIGKMQGSGQQQEIGAIVYAGIIITLLIGIPLTAIMFHMTSIFDLLGQQPIISRLAGEYFQGIAFGFVPSLIGAVYMQFFMGISKTKIILYLTSLGIFINSTFSYILIFGFKFIPPMGMFGGGFASAITAWILLAITIIISISSPAFSRYGLFNFGMLNLKYLTILLKIKTPISIQYSVEILSFSVVTYLMGLVGTEALGAQQIALQCLMIGIMIIMAISQSSSILISQAVGQSNLSAFTQIFDSGRNIAAGLLRGLSDTKFSMWTGIISCWLIGIPAAITFGFLFHFGAPGVRFGIMLGILIGCINLIYHFYILNKNKLGEKLVYVN